MIQNLSSAPSPVMARTQRKVLHVEKDDSEPKPRKVQEKKNKRPLKRDLPQVSEIKALDEQIKKDVISDQELEKTANKRNHKKTFPRDSSQCASEQIKKDVDLLVKKSDKERKKRKKKSLASDAKEVEKLIDVSKQEDHDMPKTKQQQLKRARAKSQTILSEKLKCVPAAHKQEKNTTQKISPQQKEVPKAALKGLNGQAKNNKTNIKSKSQTVPKTKSKIFLELNKRSKIEEKIRNYPKVIAQELEEDVNVSNRILDKVGSFRLVTRRIDAVRGVLLIMTPTAKNLCCSSFGSITKGMHMILSRSSDNGVGTSVVVIEVDKLKLLVVLNIKGMKAQTNLIVTHENYFLRCDPVDKLIDYYSTEVVLNENELLQVSKNLDQSGMITEIEGKKTAAPVKVDTVEDLLEKFNAIRISDADPRIPEIVGSGLNGKQLKAVEMAMNPKRRFTCIQGPPGTGKTRTLAELISVLYRRKEKVLVCAPSNVAVDNIFQATKKRFDELGIGYNKSVLDIGNADSLEEEIKKHPEFRYVLDMRAQQRCLPSRERRSYDTLEKNCRAIYNKLQTRFASEIKVFFSTLGSSLIKKLIELSQFSPELIIIDEASQTTEASVWPVLHFGKRCVLAGDHKQLPAVIRTEIAEKEQFNISLMERLLKEGVSDHHILLEVQHRMNASIMLWSSQIFYQSQLVAHESVRGRSLKSILKSEHHTNKLFHPIILLDTELSEARSYRENFGDSSSFNRGEIVLVKKYVQKLMVAGVENEKIAIITPYNGQKRELAIALKRANIEIGVFTVDEFQGQEREVVVFSFVKNNPKSIGFLKETRRGNVAVTRAKLQFALVASSRMLLKHKHFKALYNTIKNQDGVLNPDDHLK
ncbi:unnamed protein product [Caenorhabditis auriculariae]|uniref:Uncharacterized protein n=1 Tax=Caenorhabditis auriculariae TaxID=2777116 RepID=A0A8S1H2L7_9PELO|nr:unnamed protein product [Caenorhabditis auriculariae]